MDLIILIIVIASIVSKVKKNNGVNKGSRKNNDYVKQIKNGFEALENTLDSLTQKQSGKTYSEREVRNKAIEEANRKQKEREERKQRELQEQRKRELEEKRRRLEQRKKQEEKERKAKEEKEMLERFHVSEQSKLECTECNEQAALKEAQKEKFCIEHYLDPLTAPFYPGNVKTERSETFNVDDYLFPTLAPYYPQTEDVATNTYK